MGWFCFLVAIFSSGYLLTGLLRRYALATQLLDVPNHRSSHVLPTPRGGGLSFVFCFIVGLLILFCLGLIETKLFFALVGSGILVAILGFLDDHKSMAVKWRLLGHFGASVFALFLVGGMPKLHFFCWTLSAGWVVNSLTIVYLVWLLNLYNFMDGIDGIAGVEAVTVCLGGAVLYYLHGDEMAFYLVIILAVAVSGFLCWNFPPARIFMGDAGSGFLGMVLGVLSIQAAKMDSHFFWSWLILLGVFIVDATVTLLRRIYYNEAIFQGHCTHAYQQVSRFVNNKHLPVTLGVLIINVVWLLPIAVAVGLDKINESLGLFVAYLPLIVLAFKFNAGKKESC